jgi:hypothetical protein
MADTRAHICVKNSSKNLSNLLTKITQRKGGALNGFVDCDKKIKAILKKLDKTPLVWYDF